MKKTNVIVANPKGLTAEQIKEYEAKVKKWLNSSPECRPLRPVCDWCMNPLIDVCLLDDKEAGVRLSTMTCPACRRQKINITYPERRQDAKTDGNP